MGREIRSAYSDRGDSGEAASELIARLDGEDPTAIAFFASHRHDGKKLGRELRRAFPHAQVVGCTTAGELTQAVSSTGGVSTLALGKSVVRRAAAALAPFDAGVGEGIAAATQAIGRALDLDLRTADPSRYVGIALIEGLKMKEEAANDALGNAAPLLSFVGGSAGDDGEFVRTRVFCNGDECDDGAALIVLDAAVPFAIGKTCSFEPKGHKLVVTRADTRSRILYELDGRPVLDVYAEILGKRLDAISTDVFMTNPLGLMIDGKPWIRSPQRVLPDGSLKFYCQLAEGAEVYVMQSTDLVEDTRRELARVASVLGAPIRGGLAFNCILRRLELDAKGWHGRFLETFSGIEMAGFHTYGESWLGHINQTLTGLWFR
jgi:hypothetical protein